MQASPADRPAAATTQYAGTMSVAGQDQPRPAAACTGTETGCRRDAADNWESVRPAPAQHNWQWWRIMQCAAKGRHIPIQT